MYYVAVYTTRAFCSLAFPVPSRMWVLLDTIAAFGLLWACTSCSLDTRLAVLWVMHQHLRHR
jgi:hypothetical protein